MRLLLVVVMLLIILLVILFIILLVILFLMLFVILFLLVRGCHHAPPGPQLPVRSVRMRMPMIGVVCVLGLDSTTREVCDHSGGLRKVVRLAAMGRVASGGPATRELHHHILTVEDTGSVLIEAIEEVEQRAHVVPVGEAHLSLGVEEREGGALGVDG